MTISIIIPTYNNAANIGLLVQDLLAERSPHICDLIVVDGGSTDQTLTIAQSMGARALQSPIKGRSAQMNYGAALAQGDIFLFLHPEIRIHPTYAREIMLAIKEQHDMGCFRFKYKTNRIFPRLGAFLSRFSALYSNAGRQTLFIKRPVFEQLNGYNGETKIMEDFELLRRGKQYFKFIVLPTAVIASTKKYDAKNYLRVQAANIIVLCLYRMGYSQEKIIAMYKRIVHVK
ncbi:rSAM/selenodomain-associated transferase 2 [Chitinophaga skermanii]|uniref:RSAM/selenodomain-associated transferase 2 n=1 Tax=Chitinophaga skermanii TaxID=331697 RepID=A0A327R4A1_9BACT|nr:TIGR04283 family arsenosugar biosynthesis glycosyltransferase [Chitinophaga skermanii]RAJ10772.1 rSAM/selenodomain-associated transferase 2 [Chitinophaga skermanii]